MDNSASASTVLCLFSALTASGPSVAPVKDTDVEHGRIFEAQQFCVALSHLPFAQRDSLRAPERNSLIFAIVATILASLPIALITPRDASRSTHRHALMDRRSHLHEARRHPSTVEAGRRCGLLVQHSRSLTCVTTEATARSRQTRVTLLLLLLLLRSREDAWDVVDPRRMTRHVWVEARWRRRCSGR